MPEVEWLIPSSRMPETSPHESSSGKPTKAFSCVRCFERKVKCDKEHPCSGCVRSGVECVFRVPAPPRRKKKRTQEDILTERLNQYEQILQQKGIDLKDVPFRQDGAKPTTSQKSVESTSRSSDVPLTTSTTTSTPSLRLNKGFVAPNLVWEEGRSRYTENNLWTRVTEEFKETSQDAIHESSDEEEEVDHDTNEADDNIDFVLGQTPSSLSTRNLHPPTQHILVIWQIYLENVHPFTMLVHGPTMSASIQKAIQNIDAIPRNLEAMMFAIYSITVVSMQEREVETTFGESRTRLLSRYRGATKSTLARAKFMGTSDIFVMQAFILHLLSMRDVYDGRTLWTLTGVALRIAEGMGLHKDGTILGLPPFMTEIRRRIWFSITSLDYRTAELSGTSKFKMLDFEKLNTQAPLNINDEDIWPGMTEPPVARDQITDMVLCSMRYEFATYWTRKIQQKGGGREASLWENFRTPTTIEEQDAAIDDLQTYLQDTYVRYCDPSVPIQLMASIVARTATGAMRLMAHHPRRWSNEEEMPESERQLVWSICMRLLEGYVLCITSKSLLRFTWHTTFYFQWHALIYPLDCITANPLLPEANDAWKLIDEIFECHPNFVHDTKKAIHVAVGNLVLKAYTAKEKAYQKEGLFLPANPPEYVQALRRQRDEAAAKRAERKARETGSDPPSRPQTTLDTNPTTISNELVNMMGFEATNQMPMSLHSMQQQLPLPPLQLPDGQTASQAGQQTVPAWFDNFNAISTVMGSDMSWATMEDPFVDQGNQMDWTQWDSILENSTNGFGGAR